MPIKVACQCGQQFVAKDELAGKAGEVSQVRHRADDSAAGCEPAAAPAKQLSDLLDDVGLRAGLRRCPGCGAEMGEATVLCVMCGYDTRLGRRLKTHTGSAVELDDEDLGELPTHGVEALDRAERQIARDKIGAEASDQRRALVDDPAGLPRAGRVRHRAW